MQLWWGWCRGRDSQRKEAACEGVAVQENQGRALRRHASRTTHGQTHAARLWCRRAAWAIAHGQHNNELVKDEGAYGGDRAVLQRDTGHPSPLNANYGLCNGPGVDQDGNTISNLCSYSKQDSTEGAESVRHMGTDLHRLARTVFAAAKKAGVCSPPQLSSRESLPRSRCAIMMETTRPIHQPAHRHARRGRRGRQAGPTD